MQAQGNDVMQRLIMNMLSNASMHKQQGAPTPTPVPQVAAPMPQQNPFAAQPQPGPQVGIGAGQPPMPQALPMPMPVAAPMAGGMMPGFPRTPPVGAGQLGHGWMGRM